MLKKISLRTTVLGYFHLETPDGFGVAAKVMKDANCEFPLLETLQRLKSRGVERSLIQRLQNECIHYINTLQTRYENGDPISPSNGVLMSLKILGNLEAFPSVYLYSEGKKLCEAALDLRPSEDPYPFLAQLRDAYGNLQLRQIKAIMQANPRGLDF